MTKSAAASDRPVTATRPRPAARRPGRWPWCAGLLAVVVFLSGCPVKPPPLAPPPSVHPTADKLIKRLTARERGLKNFWAKGETLIKRAREEASADGSLMGLYPDALRLELIDPVGRPRMTFTSDGKQIGLLVHSEAKFYIGPATARNLSRILPLGLGIREMLVLLTGGTPLIRHQYGRVDYLARERQYRLRLGGDPRGVYQVLWFAIPGLELVRTEILDRQSHVLFRAVFSKFRRIGGVAWPMHAVLAAPRRKVKVEFTYQWLKINLAMNRRPFVVQAPAGVKVIHLKTGPSKPSP